MPRADVATPDEEPVRQVAPRATGADHNSPAAQVARVAVSAVHVRIIKLIKAWSQTKERYADLRSRARTAVAHQLISRIRDDQEEQKDHKRKYLRRTRSRAKFDEAIERFIGDLLRARAGTAAPVRIFRSLGKSTFNHAPVKYDVFSQVLEGLKTLMLVGHQKGKTRFRKTEFGPGEIVSIPRAGHASRFWATGKLLRLAEHYGINTDNFGEHFTPEPPLHPLVLKDYATGRGGNRERGRKVKYEHTPGTERLEADIRELNEFLSHFELMGGEHYGYTRVFNNQSWSKGGRLYSDGEHNYQQLPEAERLKMTINGEPVAEIDIKASQLTIYHAMVGEPLGGSSDPYARAGLDRAIAKTWTVISFGNGTPATRWPQETVKDYEKEHLGQDLRRLAKAKDVARKMLETFPALKKLDGNSELWGDLQFLESQPVVGTILILMREHGVPSLSMHDGLIVPRSQMDLAKGILSQEFRRVVGVAPRLTVDAEEPEAAASDL
jgi:hypothetical protein